MKKKYLFYLASLFLWSCASDSEDDLVDLTEPSDNITYTINIKPIIDLNCIFCHRDPPINDAPMSLLNFENVKEAIQNRNLIERISKQTGESGAMPIGGPRLPQNLIDLIIQWKDEGFKEGE